MPSCTAAAPSRIAAATPAASAMPPAAITGTRTAAATCGSSAIVPACVVMSDVSALTGNTPRWPPASAPCAMTASTPCASSHCASATVVAEDQTCAPVRRTRSSKGAGGRSKWEARRRRAAGVLRPRRRRRRRTAGGPGQVPAIAAKRRDAQLVVERPQRLAPRAASRAGSRRPAAPWQKKLRFIGDGLAARARRATRRRHRAASAGATSPHPAQRAERAGADRRGRPARVPQLEADHQGVDQEHGEPEAPGMKARETVAELHVARFSTDRAAGSGACLSQEGETVQPPTVDGQSATRKRQRCHLSRIAKSSIVGFTSLEVFDASFSPSRQLPPSSVAPANSRRLRRPSSRRSRPAGSRSRSADEGILDHPTCRRRSAAPSSRMPRSPPSVPRCSARQQTRKPHEVQLADPTNMIVLRRHGGARACGAVQQAAGHRHQCRGLCWQASPPPPRQAQTAAWNDRRAGGCRPSRRPRRAVASHKDARRFRAQRAARDANNAEVDASKTAIARSGGQRRRESPTFPAASHGRRPLEGDLRTT